MNRTRLALFVLGAVALVWRALVLFDPASSPLLGEESSAGDLNLLFARSLMGMVFLACGAIVLRRLDSKRSAVFVLYAFCAAIHWGGPVAMSSDRSQMAAWLLYFVVSAMLAQAAFLHFTLVFPEPWRWGPRHSTRFVIYLPVALGVVAASIVLSEAPGTVADGWRDKFFILEGLQTNLFALVGLIVLAIRFVRQRPLDGPRSITGFLAFGGWASVLPWAVATALESRGIAVPGGSEPYTLCIVLMPLAFTRALFLHGK